MTYYDFFSPFLDTPPASRGEEYTSFRCPLHDDHTASAGVSHKTGVFNCFVCGALSPAEFLHRISDQPLEHCYNQVQEFREEHKLIEQLDTFITRLPGKTPKFEELYDQSRRLMSPDQPVVKEYLQHKKLRYETLLHHQVGYLPAEETHWKRDSLVFPYKFHDRVVGIRYRDISGNKGGEENTHFTLWGIDDLDREPEVVLIVEGETDRLALWEALTYGEFPLEQEFVVLSTPTATFRREWLRELQGVRQVILIPQADEASLKMQAKVKEWLPSAVILNLQWRRKQVGKDVNDWLRYNTMDEIQIQVQTVLQKGSRRLMTGEEFQREANKPRPWLIKNLIARNNLGMIAGNAKAMKTWLALNICRTLLIPGDEFCDIPEMSSEIDSEANIMFIEEEGDKEDLYSRADKVFQGTNWKKHIFWGYRLGVQLDEPEWGERLSQYVEEYSIDLIILDPFQRLHTRDENSASDMAPIWRTLAALLKRHPQLSIIMLHHFTKIGSIYDKWTAFRGSGRTAAELDLGIFVEKLSRNQGSGVRVVIDGRSIIPPTSATGDEALKLRFQNGLFSVEN